MRDGPRTAVEEKQAIQSTHAGRRAKRVAAVLTATVAVGAMSAVPAQATFGSQPLGKLYIKTPDTLVTNVGQDNKLVVQYGNKGTGALSHVQVGCSRLLPFVPLHWEAAVQRKVNYKDLRSPLVAGQSANAAYEFEGRKVGVSAIICAIRAKDVATGKWFVDAELTLVKVNRSRSTD